MPLVFVFLAGAGVGVYATSKTEDLVKLALIGAVIFAGGKSVKAW